MAISCCHKASPDAERCHGITANVDRCDYTVADVEHRGVLDTVVDGKDTDITTAQSEHGHISVAKKKPSHGMASFPHQILEPLTLPKLSLIHICCTSP